jgi:hypothetical protein
MRPVLVVKIIIKIQIRFLSVAFRENKLCAGALSMSGTAFNKVRFPIFTRINYL